jgi:hypothetical protein
MSSKTSEITVIAALNSATCHRLRASDGSGTFDLPQEMEVLGGIVWLVGRPAHRRFAGEWRHDGQIL